MKTWKKRAVYTGGMILMCAAFVAAAIAGGQPLKANVCGACHADYSAIMPKDHPDVGKAAACLPCHAQDPAKNEATKFSTAIHKIHQGEKIKLECSSCHAL